MPCSVPQPSRVHWQHSYASSKAEKYFVSGTFFPAAKCQDQLGLECDKKRINMQHPAKPSALLADIHHQHFQCTAAPTMCSFPTIVHFPPSIGNFHESQRVNWLIARQDLTGKECRSIEHNGFHMTCLQPSQCIQFVPLLHFFIEYSRDGYMVAQKLLQEIGIHQQLISTHAHPFHEFLQMQTIQCHCRNSTIFISISSLCHILPAVLFVKSTCHSELPLIVVHSIVSCPIHNFSRSDNYKCVNGDALNCKHCCQVAAFTAPLLSITSMPMLTPMLWSIRSQGSPSTLMVLECIQLRLKKQKSFMK